MVETWRQESKVQRYGQIYEEVKALRKETRHSVRDLRERFKEKGVIQNKDQFIVKLIAQVRLLLVPSVAEGGPASLCLLARVVTSRTSFCFVDDFFLPVLPCCFVMFLSKGVPASPTVLSGWLPMFAR